MTRTRTPLFLGNWKLNHGPQATQSFLESLLPTQLPSTLQFGIAPPFVSLTTARSVITARSLPLGVFAQTVSDQTSGAFTGEISAPLLSEVGCKGALVGHSERRQIYRESDALIAQKLLRLLEHRLQAVLCMGETLAEREAGQTFSRIETQTRAALKDVPPTAASNLILAYEPVWAIGTGKNATAKQAQEVHAFLRKLLGELWNPATAATTRILYGGSVKPENSGELSAEPDIDGFLVGGASLKSKDFVGIIQASRFS